MLLVDEPLDAFAALIEVLADALAEALTDVLSEALVDALALALVDALALADVLALVEALVDALSPDGVWLPLWLSEVVCWTPSAETETSQWNNNPLAFYLP